MGIFQYISDALIGGVIADLISGKKNEKMFLIQT